MSTPRKITPYSKPWQIQAAVKEIHKKMQMSIQEWLDNYFIHGKNAVAPDAIKPHLVVKDAVGVRWLKSEKYHWDHKKLRHISDTSFAMVFDLYKKDKVVNSFEFVINHDEGAFKSPHKFAAMIYVGEID